MKKRICLVLALMLISAVLPVSAKTTVPMVEAILGSGGSVIAENFSGKDASGAPLFLDKVYYKNDTRSMPGWGMVAESSEIKGVDVSALGEKEYVIPLDAEQLTQDIGIRFGATAEGTKNAALDVWNIPIENIRGADKYRIEYNVYLHNPELEEPSGLLSAVMFYSPDVQNVDKTVGLIGFTRTGKVVKITDVSKNKFADIKDGNGNSIEFKNDSWQHVAIDVDNKNQTYTFQLNGTELLKNEKLSGIVNLNAESGTYRVRFNFRPFKGDLESFVVFDDVLFVKYTEEGLKPYVSVLQNGSESVQDANRFTSLTKFVGFTGVQNGSESNVTLYEAGKPVKAEIQNQNGVVRIGNDFKAKTPYTVEFNRFASPDGKQFFAENIKIPLFCHMVSVDDAQITDSTVSLAVTAGEKTEAVVSVTCYNSVGEMTNCVFSEALTLEKGATEKISVSDISIENGGTVEVSVLESITNPIPLCPTVTLR